MSPTLFYSSLVIVSSGLISLFLALISKKDSRLAERPFFRYWAIGFALFSLVHAPAAALNFVKNISYNVAITAYIIVFFAILGAAFLWYRGTMFFFTKSSRWLVTYPLVYSAAVAALVLGLLFFGFKVPIILTFWIILVPLPLDLFISGVFLWFFISCYCYEDKKRRLAPLIISLSWLSFLVLDVIIWRILYQFPADFWIVRLASVSQWYLARAASHFLLLVGLFLFHRHLTASRPVLQK